MRATLTVSSLLAVALLALGALAPEVGRAQSQPKFPTPIPAPKTTPAPAAAPSEAVPAPTPPAPSANTPTGARDPFEPLVQKAQPGQAQPGQDRTQELANLRLVAVMWYTTSPDQPMAMVEAPDGLGYYLRINDERFGGKVVAIEKDRIRFSVREQQPNQPVRLRTVELRLPKPEGS